MTDTKALRVLIVDDHPTVCEGLRYRISAEPDMAVCGEAATLPAALEMIDEQRPDVLIVDIALKNSDGLELIKTLAARRVNVPALVHSMYDETVYADRCLRAGAMGYVTKEADPDDVIRAIREVHAGRVYLSPHMARTVLNRTVRGRPDGDPVDGLTDRQLEIFRMIGDGQSAQQIAGQLHISVNTFETHRENIKRKLNVGTAAELNRLAVLWAAENR